MISNAPMIFSLRSILLELCIDLFPWSTTQRRYSILALTLLLMLLGILVLGSRRFSEGLAATWSGIMLCALSVGGTMIMRKFHSSLAVGFFMGCVVAMSQMFFMLFLVYVSMIGSYAEEKKN